ncbi:hypothetical protein EV213_101240 [Aureibacillus halotolerans]|uniref:Uncharacterized protein n=1 Tax=Aureibacillus halotolerans TaxID=1508390 RepID=A0A4R6U8T1_9BACI|nr:hypothetical protein EV213_101240 [Aureibacillus halotolerans]
MSTAPSTNFAFCGARLQLPGNLAFRGDLQLALIPLESTLLTTLSLFLRTFMARSRK